MSWKTLFEKVLWIFRRTGKKYNSFRKEKNATVKKNHIKMQKYVVFDEKESLKSSLKA